MGFVVFPYNKADLLKDSGFDIKWILLLATIAGVCITELGYITPKVVYGAAYNNGTDRNADYEDKDEDDETDKLVYRAYAGNRKRRSMKYDAEAVAFVTRKPKVSRSESQVASAAKAKADVARKESSRKRRRREDDEETDDFDTDADTRDNEDNDDADKWDPDAMETNGRRRSGWGHAEMTLIHMCLHGFITQVACILLTYFRNDMHILTEVLLMSGNSILSIAAVVMLIMSLLDYQAAGETRPAYRNVETNTIVLIAILVLLIVAMFADIGVNVRRMQLDDNMRPTIK